jgi:hypothetical protein
MRMLLWLKNINKEPARKVKKLGKSSISVSTKKKTVTKEFRKEKEKISKKPFDNIF